MKTKIFQSISIFIIPAVFLLILFSCVPNKKLVYLQDKDVKEIYYPRDSIIKAYDDQYRKYKLQPGDIITVRIGSLTPSEFNFVKDYEEQLGSIRKLSQYDPSTSFGGANQNIPAQYLLNQAGGSNSTLLLDRQNTGFVLDEFGALQMPKIGDVVLKGLDLDEAEKLVEDSLKGFFETPIVRVQLMSFQFSIVGEVGKEGRYTTYNPKTNIFDAFIMANNLTEFADRANIKIIRQVNGKSMVIYLNTLDQNSLEANNLYIYPGDMIIVPPLHARYWRKYVLPETGSTLSLITAAISLLLLVYTITKK